eukprot:GHVS01040122.1.p1 GENE.GHVS01040122.1~~GHVS01040122.1.p1  ORF type:complete len:604 (+),score=119.21 GHVS01040122.1:103-1914(+)
MHLHHHLNTPWLLVTCFFLLLVPLASSRSNEIRGVNPKFFQNFSPTSSSSSAAGPPPIIHPHWAPSEICAAGFFRCLCGTLSIPFAALNDDFCDCPDGSDEPGTSACAGASWLFRARDDEARRRKKGFYCPNLGYLSKVVHHTMTNDGICDCCDGSDEWEVSAICPDVCDEQAKGWKADRARSRQGVAIGLSLKQTYIEEGGRWLATCRDELASLNRRLPLLIEQAEAAEAKVKKTAERRSVSSPSASTAEEASAVKMGGGGKEEVTENGEGGNDLGTVSEFAKWALHDGIDAATEEKYHHSVNDPEEEGMTTDRRQEQKESWLIMAKQQGLKLVEAAREWMNVARRMLPPPYASVEIRRHYDQFVEKSAGWSVDHVTGRIEHGMKYAWKQLYNGAIDLCAAMSLIDELRKAPEEEAKDLRSEVRYTELRIQEFEGYLKLNLGAQSEFYPLTRECAKRSFDGFDYEICFFKDATQGDRSHSHFLGRVESFEEEDASSQELLANFPEDLVDVEEEGPSTGGRVYVMRFRNGSKCHDNSKRELTVKFLCGSSVQLMQVHEPSRCRYYATVKCPSACSAVDEQRFAMPGAANGGGGDNSTLVKEEL